MKEVVLRIDKLNKYYKKFHAIKDVSFNVYRGEIIGFIGPNGSGKSTTMKCISNLLYPESGVIEICGHNLKDERDLALSNIAALIESPGLYFELSGQDNLELMAGIKGVGKDKIAEIKEFINIGDNIYRKVRQYSTGMKQRLAIGIALLSDPRFLILDEPTNGLDPTGVIELRNNLLNLVKERDISILFSSHQLGEIEKIADRIIGIKKGEIVSFDRNVTHQVNYLIEVIDDINSNVFDNIKEVLKCTISNKIIDITISTKDSLQLILDIISTHTRIVNIENSVVPIEDVYVETFGDEHEKNF